MQEKDYLNNGGAQDRAYEAGDRLDYALRNRKLDWRHQWWLNGRDPDDKVMGRVIRLALDYKHKMIQRQRETADHLAAYGAPSAAGSPWVTIGPRNINGRVKCLAVHPTDAQTVKEATLPPLPPLRTVQATFTTDRLKPLKNS